VNVERVLVTGGAGFLGQAILRELARPPWTPGFLKEVRVFDRVPLDGPGHPNQVAQIGDVCDYESLLRACRGVDVVVHAASLIDWGQETPETLDAANVGGTENVLRACREAGVPGLVYTSSMDVVCGSEPVVNADETLAYPARFANDYARTKAEAEQRVLAAHGSARTPRSGEESSRARLSTCAIRPCGMFGEGDPYHVANVLRIVRDGGLPVRPGSGRAAFQHVYVGNVAHAHALAIHQLVGPDSALGGQAYFITDDTPAINFFDFMEPIVTQLGYSLPPKSRSVPYPVMFAIGAILEAASAVCRPFFRFTPTITRSSIRFVCHDHTFVGDKARRDLGYAPIYSEAEALERTVEYFRERVAAL
jgi:nucleoside-diphosphate-sugar epimerase